MVVAKGEGNALMRRILRVKADLEAVFIERINRFLAAVDIDGSEELVHLHDPGRLSELLFYGNRVLIKSASSPSRKTRWDLLAAHNENSGWVFVHSGYHRQISEKLLSDPDLTPIRGIGSVRAEVKLGKSRTDFLVRRKGTDEELWLEVKGCTLARGGVALFPDAPTERGRRHLAELSDAVKRGKSAGVLFLIFRSDSKCFMPNEETDAKFASEFWRGVSVGVKMFPFVLNYDGEWISFVKKIPLCANGG